MPAAAPVAGRFGGLPPPRDPGPIVTLAPAAPGSGAPDSRASVATVADGSVGELGAGGRTGSLTLPGAGGADQGGAAGELYATHGGAGAYDSLCDVTYGSQAGTRMQGGRSVSGHGPSCRCVCNAVHCLTRARMSVCLARLLYTSYAAADNTVNVEAMFENKQQTKTNEF